MSPLPAWLPELFHVDRQEDEVVDSLHGVFQQDFIVALPKFRGLSVWWDRRVGARGYHEGFWHIITKGEITPRQFDPRRAERLPWCGPPIPRCNELCYLVWDYKEGDGAIRTYVWYRDGDYVIVLERRQFRIGTIAFLITAYYVESEGRKRQLWTKYSNREA